MRAPIPIAGLVGLAASAIAIGMWAAEQFTGNLAFEFLTIPVKLVVLAAPLCFLPDLSAFLHGRQRLAVCFGLVLVTVTVCAMLAYLPWRQAFTEHFSNHVYRWYFDGMPQKYPGFYGGFADWQQRWSQRIPHAIEAGLVMAYYGFLITACTIRRLGKRTGAGIAVAGYALLFLVPMLTGLINWDYDTFLMDIAFDSISMDLFPIYFWHAGDYSIFLYVFMLIFFGVSTAFFFAKSRSAA